jgi:glycerol-3-phosphate acyltransferase PlsY
MFFTDADRNIHLLTTPALSPLLLGGLLGYLLGSIPAAFIIVRWRSRLDIRQAGSGNVGTLNSYQVTGSKSVGILVLAIDFLKGYAAVVTASVLFGGSFAAIAGAGVGAALGHNFPVWLRFRGGRGLATTAGVFMYLSPAAVALWAACWAVGFGALRKVNIANAAATLVLLVLAWLLPDPLLMEWIHPGSSVTGIRIFCTCILSVILIGHYKPLSEIFAEFRTQK